MTRSRMRTTGREELRGQYREMLRQTKNIAAELTEARRTAAKKLEQEIVRELSELDMDKVTQCASPCTPGQSCPRTALTP